MDFKQTTLGEILDSEKEMILSASKMYGDFFINADEFNQLLYEFIDSINDLSKIFSLPFLGHVKKHHTLALFSAVRRHHVQFGMNMRQVIEAGAWAAYAMAQTEEEKFMKIDQTGRMHVSKKLKEERNKWLNDNFKIKSDELRNLKKIINESLAHANIIYAFERFRVKPADDPGFEMKFFDPPDEYRIKMDLWFVANTALGLLDLFYGVNQQFNVFKLIPDYLPRYTALVKQNNELKAEITKHPRFVAATSGDNTGL